MRNILVVGLVLPLLLGGCSQVQNMAAKPVISDGVNTVAWSSLPGSEQQAIIKVAKYYGDANPKVLWIHQTVTDPDGELMYCVSLSGHFQQGDVQSSDVEFSILGDGTKVWAFSNTDGTFKHEIQDNILH